MSVFLMSEKGETCIQVRAGEKFALKFLTSPGTGYSWEFAAEPDSRLLEFVEARNEESEKQRFGGSEFAVWTFMALAAGKTEISLKYVRPWEKEAPAAKEHVFKVSIGLKWDIEEH
ncbi:MAG TPA: protease inhibitor I42 family protein [Patescibacteria group bacterium]|nr:protease inhibitor I42 family protein [Patescibacteria group bacterium]